MTDPIARAESYFTHIAVALRLMVRCARVVAAVDTVCKRLHHQHKSLDC